MQTTHTHTERSTIATAAAPRNPRRTKHSLLSVALIALALGTGGVVLASGSDEQRPTSNAPAAATTDATGTARDLVCDRVPPRPNVAC